MHAYTHGRNLQRVSIVGSDLLLSDVIWKRVSPSFGNVLVQLLLADWCAGTCALQGAEEGPESGATTYIISLAGAVKGYLDEAHLGDHPAAVAALAECVSEGTDLGDLMVLERMQVRRHLGSLCSCCHHHQHAVLPGVPVRPPGVPKLSLVWRQTSFQP